jgi:putative flavoprotein involved in K+ transport
MRLLGHVREIRDGRVALAADLGDSLAAGDRAFYEFTSAVDHYLRRRGAGSSEPPPSPSRRISQASVDEVDLRASKIQSVVWATGYVLDFRWIELPIFDARGEPVQKRGVTSAPGIYFLGLAWMHKVKSSFLYGVGEDAQYLAERICDARATAENISLPNV